MPYQPARKANHPSPENILEACALAACAPLPHPVPLLSAVLVNCWASVSGPGDHQQHFVTEGVVAMHRGWLYAERKFGITFPRLQLPNAQKREPHRHHITFVVYLLIPLGARQAETPSLPAAKLQRVDHVGDRRPCRRLLTQISFVLGRGLLCPLNRS